MSGLPVQQSKLYIQWGSYLSHMQPQQCHSCGHCTSALGAAGMSACWLTQLSFQHSHTSLLGSSYTLILAQRGFNKKWVMTATSKCSVAAGTHTGSSGKQKWHVDAFCAFTPMRQVLSPKYLCYLSPARLRVGIEAAVSSCSIPHHTGQCCRYLMGTVSKIKRELLSSHWQERCSAHSSSSVMGTEQNLPDESNPVTGFTSHSLNSSVWPQPTKDRNWNAPMEGNRKLRRENFS